MLEGRSAAGMGYASRRLGALWTGGFDCAWVVVVSVFEERCRDFAYRLYGVVGRDRYLGFIGLMGLRGCFMR